MSRRSWNGKKATSNVVLLTLLVNILAPTLTYAAVPLFSNTLIHPNVDAVAQVNEVRLPRDLLSGDVLDITISGSLIMQDFSGSHLETSNLLNAQIDSLPGIISIYEDSLKTFTITSEMPGIHLVIGDLHITRQAIDPTTTVANIVAIAQESELSIPQELFEGDEIHFTVGGVSVSESFVGDKDTTLLNFANNITANTIASGSYDDVAKRINLTAKTPGTGFGMSNLTIISRGIPISNTIANVAPIAQIEEISFPRIIYPDETISLTISGITLTQAYSRSSSVTLDALSAQIDSLGSVTSSALAGVITITSAVPGEAFAISGANLVGGIVASVNDVPNQAAISQEDTISVPRDVFLNETVNLYISGSTISQGFSLDTDYTINELITKINATPDYQVSAYNSLLRNITIKAKNPGVAFAHPTLNITSSFPSANITANQVAQKQVSSYLLPRDLVAGDQISAMINGSPITQVFATGSTDTLTSFAQDITISNSGIIIADLLGDDTIELQAATVGVGFTAQNLMITNTLAPVVLVANVTPVKQKETISFQNEIVQGDIISLALSGETTSQTITQAFDSSEGQTLIDLSNQINSLPDFTASVNVKNLIIEPKKAGVPIAVTQISTAGQMFTGTVTIPNLSETKAAIRFNVAGVPASTDTFTIGGCAVSFDSVGTENDCSDNATNLDISGTSDPNTVATLIRGLVGVNDSVQGPLSTGGVGSEVVFNAINTPVNSSDIAYDLSDTDLNILLMSLTNPAVPQAKTETLSLPRDFAPGDSFQMIIDGITVTQNFLSSSGVSFANLLAQINALPNTSASGADNVIFLQAKTPGVLFELSSAGFVNTQTSQTTVSNVYAVAQSEEINFPAPFVAGDIITIMIDGAESTVSFNSDHNTTMADLTSSITANTDVSATASGLYSMVLTAQTAGEGFVIDKLEIKNTVAINHTTPNASGTSQVEELVIPFAPASGDVLNVTIDGTTLTQNFVSDATTTLSALNTQIDNLANVNSSYDTASGAFIISAQVAGVPFVAGFSSVGATIDSINIQPNTESGAQVDSLIVSRDIAPNDMLTLNIADSTLTQSFVGTKDDTLNALNSQIDALPELLSTYESASGSFTITSEVPGTAFTGGTLAITSINPSTNLVPNVPAVAQVDTISMPRNLISGDRLNITVDGAVISEDFTGSSIITLDNFANKINSSISGAVATSAANELILTASVPGVAFLASDFSIDNTRLATTTVDNVVAVKQETGFDMPAFVAGDRISLTINAVSINQDFISDDSATAADLLSKLDATGLVVSSLSGSLVNMVSAEAGQAFVVSQISIINTTVPTIKVANVVPEAQVVNMYPSGDLREGITFRATINDIDYDYLTSSSDGTAEIIAGLQSAITSTGVTVSTGSDMNGEFLELTSSIPGIAFTYDSLALDITPPVVTMTTDEPQTLRSGIESTSDVSINEDGAIYLILSGTIIATELDIADAMASDKAFIVSSPANAGTSYNVTVPAGATDGSYDFIAVDGYHNVSQAIPSWLTVDNTAPIVHISNVPQMVNTNSVTIGGITEPNTGVTITSGLSNVDTVSDGAGAFSGIADLNINAANTITVTATDGAGNIGSGSIVVIQDSLAPAPFILDGPAFTNSGSANVSVTTESGILAEIYSSGILLQTGMTDLSGFKNFNIPLVADSANNFHVIISDMAGNTDSGNIIIIQDSIAPNIILDPLPGSIHAASINISGTTEPNSIVVLDNSGMTSTGVADGAGAFDIAIALNNLFSTKTINDITVTVTDTALNSSFTGVTIIEDSIPNSLLINTPSLSTSSTTITVSGSTKAGSDISISGGIGTVNTVADPNGDFSAEVGLNQNAANILDVTSTDQVGNVSSGTITVINDTIAPAVSIITPAHPTNDQVINMIGTTEGNSVISITGGSGTYNGVSDVSGFFNIPIELSQGVQNDILVTSVDQAGNVGTGSISITHDPIVISIMLGVPSENWTNQDEFAFTGITKSGATVSVTGGSGSLELVADQDGSFSGVIALNQNTANDIVATATDATTMTSSQGFRIHHDNISPDLALSQSGTINTNSTDMILDGLTESGATVTLSNGVSTISSTATGAGVFSLSFPLIPNSTNTISGTSVDLAGNVSAEVSIVVNHDDVGPVISSLTATPAISGPIMNLNYSFTTDEVSDSILFIGSGSNVLSTLLATGTTNGTVHAGTITGLSPTQAYYYFVRSTDAFGNPSQSPISTINSSDNAGPVLLSRNISNISNNGARLDFSFQDAHFNTGTLASATVSITDGISSSALVPEITYSEAINTGILTLTGLIPSTVYDYTITLKDDFGNQTANTASFMTSGDIVLSGGTIVQSGSVTIPVGVAGVTFLNGTAIVINSIPSTSGLGSGSISIPGSMEIISETGWNGVISSPALVDPNSNQAGTNAELAAIVSAMNTTTMIFAPNVAGTISVGGNAGLVASGGVFMITADFTQNLAGQTLYIFRSQDGNGWMANTPAATCVVSPANTCTFGTDHLTYFTFATITGTEIPVVTPPTTPVSSGGGGGGGGYAAKDRCPNGDYSASYYDASCGVNLGTGIDSSITGTGASQNGTSSASKLEQDASRFILDVKQDNYPIATTLDQKINVWQKVIDEMDSKLDDQDITEDEAQLYVNIRDKAKSLLDELQLTKESPDKIIDQNPSDDYDNQTGTDYDSTPSSAKYIEVDHVVIVRSHPSYKGKIVAYLPRNYKVNVLEYGELWSKIAFGDSQTAFIRNKFLRDENRQDRGRTASQMIFLGATIQADVDMRKIKVANSVWVRKGPGKDYDKKSYLKDGDQVLILDARTVNGWYEIRSKKGTGWVFGRYIEELKK